LAATRYIAFLRAVNVGGHTIRMDELRDVFARAGFTGVETFIASGNVIFHAPARAGVSLEKKIEAALLTRFQYEVCTFVRTAAEVSEVACREPFPAKRIASARAFVVGFLREPLTVAQGKTLETFTSDVDAFRTEGREMYWLCRVGQGESEFSNARFEKTLGVRATFRGINTVRRLAAKYPAERG